MVLRDPEAKRKVERKDDLPNLGRLLSRAEHKYKGTYYAHSYCWLGFPDGSVLVTRLNYDHIWEGGEITSRSFYWEFRAYGL